MVAASGSKDAASCGPEPEPEPSAVDSVLEHDFDLEYAIPIELRPGQALPIGQARQNRAIREATAAAKAQWRACMKPRSPVATSQGLLRMRRHGIAIVLQPLVGGSER